MVYRSDLEAALARVSSLEQNGTEEPTKDPLQALSQKLQILVGERPLEWKKVKCCWEDPETYRFIDKDGWYHEGALVVMRTWRAWFRGRVSVWQIFDIGAAGQPYLRQKNRTVLRDKHLYNLVSNLTALQLLTKIDDLSKGR